jgi:hypothetical protein
MRSVTIRSWIRYASSADATSVLSASSNHVLSWARLRARNVVARARRSRRLRDLARLGCGRFLLRRLRRHRLSRRTRSDASMRHACRLGSKRGKGPCDAGQQDHDGDDHRPPSARGGRGLRRHLIQTAQLAVAVPIQRKLVLLADPDGFHHCSPQLTTEIPPRIITPQRVQLSS